MSVTIYTKENLKINNCKDGRVFVEGLVNYINQFNNMDSMLSLRIEEMVISSNERAIKISNFESFEEGNCLVLTEEGLIETKACHFNWENDSELMTMVESLDKAEKIEFSISFDAEFHSDSDYGVGFWSGIIEDNFNIAKQCIEYRATEIVDCDWDVNSVYFDSNGFNDIKEEFDISIVKDIKEWYSLDFLINVMGDEKIEEGSKVCNELLSIFNKLIETLDMGEMEEDDIFGYGEYQLENSASLKLDNLNEVLENLRRMKEVADNNDYEINIKAEFVPLEGLDTFAKLSIVEDENGEIKVSCFRF